MKCFRDVSLAKVRTNMKPRHAALLLIPAVVSAGWALADWRNAEAGTAIESALYRLMPMPVSKVLGLRPPKEATPLLSELIKKQPTAELYSLRALNEEAALDFATAEADWKKYTQLAPDKTQAQFALADFYLRRNRPTDEIAALGVIARAPATPNEKRTAIEQQNSWLAFERIFKVIRENALPTDASDQNYRAWIDRYPEQQAVYSRYLQFLLDHKSFAVADKLIARYQSARPNEEVFPVKARALLAYKKGSVEQGLALYDRNFQPLWPQELIDSYFGLVTETRSLRKFLDHARADLERNPEDLNAAARIFYYYQRQGRTDAAQQAITQFRLRKEQRNAKWNSQDLYTLAKLNEGIKNYPEAARYYYALYNTNDKPDAPELALAGMINALLDAPEQGIRLGSGELSMYRDIASMDRGPGFLNGILSLVMNTTAPGYAYSEEEQRAVPYFHRAEAAQLTRLFESRFPTSKMRSGLRARLIEAYSAYGESSAVIREGQQFLTAFPDSPDRERVAMLLADAFARENRTQEEFALYDTELADLAKRAEGLPVGMSADAPVVTPRHEERPDSTLQQAEGEQAEATEESGDETQSSGTESKRAFSTTAATPVESKKTPQAWYSDFLERYLSRLASMKQVSQALAVLRKEIDRNPNDPGLYERLAQFLQQNQLGAEQEQVYQRAIQQFPDKSWYHKLARFYLREKRDADFSRLSEQVIKIFSGTELESYFSDVVNGRDYYVRLNEFAHARFPHDLMFVRNLLRAYRWPGMTQSQKWDALIRQNWWQDEDLRNEYFEYLSSSGRLDQELAALRQTEAKAQQGDWSALASSNPVAARFVAEVGFWRSHFEDAAPVMNALAQQYPADFDLGRRASAVHRSLAAFDPRNTELAVKIEDNLFKADPGSRDTLARIGDIYSDRELFDQAAPYWDRMAQIRPGEPQAYLDTATIYWDYYDYDSALKWLARGREKLDDPALFAYETGAIYENKREYPHAIAEYLKGALKEHEGSRPYNRLLDLARRKNLRDEVDRSTASLAAGASPSIDAIKLRLAVLETQNRPKEVEQLLADIGERTTSLETLEWLEETARQKSLNAVQEKVLEKQATVTTDPVRKLELRYSLVRFYESNKDLVRAQRNIDALYRENPKILGVVRSTVDFYWQNKGRQHAVDVLLQAANDSCPDLAKQFRFEAAQKSTENGQYDQSRKLLTQLLTGSPYDGSYLAAMADTYARAGDDAGLKQFYLNEIDIFKKAPLTQDARTQQIASLRRGLIPALTRMKDFAGAVDQYIEIINRYPEDDALISEAALYAQRNGRQQQLLGYYANTIKQSPKDYRWPMVLAKMQTQVEDYPAAVETYATAINIRPDRVDLRTARGELLERLMRFDDAAAEYQRLFELNYKDPRWMEKLAEIRARQGRTNDAVAALTVALIENRPEKPATFFDVARRLEAWGMLPQARDFAQKGVESAGRDLLAVSENQSGAQLYVELATRLRRQSEAYATLQRAVADADSLGAEFATAVNQVQKNGIASITDKQWRDRALSIRRDTARSGMQSAMQTMGKTVNQFFTPEEKLQFASWLDTSSSQASDTDIANIFLPAADSAELPDQQARWLQRLMLDGSSSSTYKSRLIALQTQRLRFQELGSALEAYGNRLSVDHGRDSVLNEAATAYRSAGLFDAEFRVLQTFALRSGGDIQERYFELLLQNKPMDLVLLSADSRTGLADAACQYTIAHGPAVLAENAVAMRGRSHKPVWTRAYAALTGLYFADRGPAINTAFVNVLGDRTIGERLSKPVDRDQQLAGNNWFYYGSRYGEWLGVSHTGDPEDFLPAQLEQSPASSSGYVTVAEYYAESGDINRAVDDYKRTLELAPRRADIHDRIAILYWRQQKRADAIAEWRQALEMLDAQVHQRVVPPSFWSTFGYVMNHVGNRHVTAEVRAQSDTVLRDYVRQNGTYEADRLLKAAHIAIGDQQGGVKFMLELASIAPEPEGMLQLLADANWIPAKERNPIYAQIIERMQANLGAKEGLSKQYAEEELRNWQSRYAMHLVEQKQFEQAAAVLQPHEQPTSSELEVRYRVALANNQFDSIIEGYRSNPDKAPQPDVLRQVATSLQGAGQRPAARKILEFLFTQEIAAHQLSSANMLGLAEIRLQDGDTAGALELLRRLALVVGQPFENLEPAARLLARNGHHSEAVDFLAQLAKAKPWDDSARLFLAQEKIAAGQDAATAHNLATAVASDPKATYKDRLAAATVLSGGTGASLGSGELDFIAYRVAGPLKPYYYAARVADARLVSDTHAVARFLQDAISDSPSQDAARAPLFYSLIDLKRDRLALSTIEPILHSWYLGGASGGYSNYDAQSGDSEEPNTEESESADGQSSGEDRIKPSDAERATLAVAVGDLYTRIGELQKSLQYYRAALKLQTTKQGRDDVNKKMASARTTIRRNANNALRMPTIHNELEQEHTVRPKLIAAVKATAPPKPARNTKGGAQ